jgi:4-hydroxy-tetrahydrodipicolinate reductase
MNPTADPAVTRVVIFGSRGRMGQALRQCAARMPQVQVVGEVDQGDDLTAALDRAEVVIDFSFHSATPACVAAARARGVAMVIGTTGHSEAERESVVGAARALPVVLAANYSTGVNTLFWLTRKAAEILGPGFDLEVIEMHHRLKRDAPSGTAARLVEILAETRQLQVSEAVRHGRVGITGERTAEEIGLHAIRGGDVVGDHTVIFAAPGERVELTHKASNRETFALGALRAAAWVVGQPAGLYDMQDVLGLR